MEQPIRVVDENRRSSGPSRDRGLLIAEDQLDRAELYLVAVEGLGLDDAPAAAVLDGLLRDLRALRQRLVGLRSRA